MSGNVVIEKQDSSIFDTHEPAIDIPPSPLRLYMMDS